MTAYINITSDPSGASVQFGGLRLPNTPVRNLRMRPGFYNIRIEKEGYIPYIHLNFQIKPKDIIVNIHKKLLTQEEVLERVKEEEEEREEEEIIHLTDAQIKKMQGIAREHNISRSKVNAIFEKDMQDKLTEDYLIDLIGRKATRELLEEEIEEKVESPFQIKLKEFKENYNKGDLGAAALSFGSMLFASWLPEDEQLITGTVPLAPGPAQVGAVISASAFLKDPKKVTALFTKLKPQGQGKVLSAWKKTELGKRAIPLLLSNVVKTQNVGWFKKAFPWLASAVAVMGTTTFMEFLYEETLQSIGIAIWTAMSNKQWAIAQEALDNAWPLLEKAEWVYKNVGWLAPYSFDVFNSYAKATRTQYEVYEKIIAAGGNAGPKPGAFDKEKFAADLASGRASPEDDLVVKPEEVEVPEEEVEEEEPIVLNGDEEEEEEEEKIRIIDLLHIPTIKAREERVKPNEIPKPFTSEQVWALNLAFEDILKLTEGAEQLSMEEFEGLVGSFSLNTDKQKEVLQLLFMDLWLLTKGANQLSSDEYILLKEKYKQLPI